MKRTYYTTDSKELSIEIPEPCNYPSFFVFSMWKAGSTMLDGMIRDISSYLHIPIIDVHPTAYMQGIDDNKLTSDICQLFVKTGYCYMGFRSLPSYLRDFDFKEVKKILLVRDPRDMLVSHYFSLKYSHGITKGDLGKEQTRARQSLFEVSIDDYALQMSENYLMVLNLYSLIEDNNLRVFKYEDIIFDKQQFMRDILYFLELKLADNLISETTIKYDIFPKSEDVNSHIRKVTPGDYKEKLKVGTITKLNECFKDILLKYQYHIEDPLGMHLLFMEQSKTFLNSFNQILDKHKNVLSKR